MIGVYSEAYFGYSAAGHSKGRLMVQYIFILMHSKLFIYHALLNSSQFGIERDTYLKEDIDSFSIIPFEDLKKTDKRKIETLVKRFAAGKKPWQDLNKFVYEIYGLSESDCEVVEDTLNMNLPYTQSKDNAQKSPKPEQMRNFANRLEKELAPFFKLTKQNLTVELPKLPRASRIFLPDTQNNTLRIGILKQARYWTQSRARLLAMEILNRSDEFFGGK